MIGLLIFLLRLLLLPLRRKLRLEAKNAALKQQLTVLQRKVRGRVLLMNSDRAVLRSALSLVPVDSQSDYHCQVTHSCAGIAWTASTGGEGVCVLSFAGS
jgi:hypothetical protein